MPVDASFALAMAFSVLIASAVFTGLHRFRREMPGLRYWAIACLVAGLAVLVDALRLVDDWRLAAVAFNVPALIVHACFLAGVLEFCDRRAGMVVPLYGALAALSVGLTFVTPDARVRIAFTGTACAAVAFRGAWVLWQQRQREAPLMYTIASATGLLYATCASAYVLLMVSGAHQAIHRPSAAPLASAIGGVGSFTGSVVVCWILFTLVGLRLMAELRLAAERDALTGLRNRRGMRLEFDRVMTAQREGGAALAVMLLDIDHFKRVNDEHGHDMGDRVLAVAGRVLHELESPLVLASRWGGEEFCVLVTGATTDGLRALAEEMRVRFARATRTIAGFAGSSISVGISTISTGGLTVAELVHAADGALYAAKRGGRDRVVAHGEATP